MNVRARRKSKFIANENGNKGSRSMGQWSKFEALQKMRETLGLEECLDCGSSDLLMFRLAHIGGTLIGARNFRLNALKESEITLLGRAIYTLNSVLRHAMHAVNSVGPFAVCFMRLE